MHLNLGLLSTGVQHRVVTGGCPPVGRFAKKSAESTQVAAMCAGMQVHGGCTTRWWWAGGVLLDGHGTDMVTRQGPFLAGLARCSVLRVCACVYILSAVCARCAELISCAMLPPCVLLLLFAPALSLVCAGAATQHIHAHMYIGAHIQPAYT